MQVECKLIASVVQVIFKLVVGLCKLGASAAQVIFKSFIGLCKLSASERLSLIRACISIEITMIQDSIIQDYL